MLQFSIALFTGMVAVTFVPPVRRSIPWPAEVSLWIGLVTVCVLGLMSVTDKSTRDLSMAAAWGAEQIVNTIFGLLLGGAGAWIYDQRIAIASVLVVVAGGDLLALMLIRSARKATPWTPRVRLGEWMELPMPGPAVPVRAPAPAAELQLQPRLAAATGVVAAAARTHSLAFSGHLRREAQALAAGMRGIETRSRIDWLRDASAHLAFAARAWYEGMGRPAMPTGTVIDIRAVATNPWPSRGEIEEDEGRRPDTLAS